MNRVDQKILDIAKMLGVEIVFDVNDCKQIDQSGRIHFEKAWAFYDTLPDKIYINLKNFKDNDVFSPNYAILHELSHWTGAPKRLKRFDYYNNFTWREAHTEEHTADLGAKFLAEFLGIDSKKEIQSREHGHVFSDRELAEKQGKQAGMYIVNKLYNRQDNSQSVALAV